MAKETVIETDVLVLGGGVAGCTAAIKSREQGLDVTMVDKSYVGKSGTTAAAGMRFSFFSEEHGDNYEQISTFTESRYGEVMEVVRDIAGIYFPIYPILDGAQILRRGDSFPRTYWEKYWIQLYLEIVDWLEPEMQAQAEERLKKLNLRYHEGIQ